MNKPNDDAVPAYIAVGKCKTCGHRIQALRMTLLGRDATPNVNPDDCMYCPPHEGLSDHA